MEDTVKIKGGKDIAKFFEEVLAKKQERKNEIRRKFKNGELKIAD
ncbi:hypothetical protein [Pseudozobellia sp. WGM2]|nr:hypothetical protein [Pseudozobellia sp. WGM2]